jgi:hypothetical protein
MDFVKVYRTPDFEKYKEALLLAVEMTKESRKCQYAKMSFSDYKEDYSNTPPLYYDLIKSIIQPHMEEYMNGWCCTEYSINRMWFAEYYDEATFGWHTHEGVNMSAVLQVELDDDRNATQLMGLNMNLSEGDFVIFPAMMPHRSPVVMSGRKTIIAFNFDMYGSTLNVEGQ